MSDQVQELVDRAIVREVSDNGEEPDGYQSVEGVVIPVDDTQALAKAQELVAQAKMANQQKCTEVVNKALEDYNCRIEPAGRLGEQAVPLAQILNLPILLLIRSK